MRIALMCFLAVALFMLVTCDTADRGPNGKAKPRIAISKETTRITTPLDDEGYVDYRAALNAYASKDVTPENNAVPLLWEAFGPATMPEEIVDEYFQLLGAPAPPEDGEYFASWDDYHRGQEGGGPGGATYGDRSLLRSPLDIALGRPWRAKDQPQLAKWLASNARPLSRVIEASRCERFYSPLVSPVGEPESINAFSFVTTASFIDVVKALIARAMLHAGEGDVEAAWQDLHACVRLGRLAGQGVGVTEFLTCVSIQEASSKAIGILAHTGITPDQALRFEKDLAALPPLPDCGEKLDVGERYQWLEGIVSIARGDSYEAPGRFRVWGKVTEGMSANKLARIDWNQVFAKINSWVDRFVEAAHKPSVRERWAAVEELDEELKELASNIDSPSSFFFGSATGRLCDELIARLVPGLLVAPFAQERAEAQARFAHLALALAAHRARHGAYPEELDDLHDPPVSLEDSSSGAPLRYVRREDGYMIYSVSRNGRDDDGYYYDPRRPGSDDIALRVGDWPEFER